MMISITVSARRLFTLAADLPAARAQFGDFRQTLRYLPDLRLVKAHAPDQYRIVYSAAQAGVYRVNLYSDVQARFDEAEDTFYVTPLSGFPAVASKATLASLTGQGDYSSRLRLSAAGERTNAEYEVRIRATLPKPVGLKMIPEPAVRLFIERVVRRRVQEIADEFIRRSTAALHAQRRTPA